MTRLTRHQKRRKIQLYCLYWACYLLIFTLIEGLTEHDFLAVLRNELISLIPKVVFVAIVVETGMKDLFDKRYAYFAGIYILLVLAFAFVLRLIDNYVILKYYLTYWTKEPLLSPAPFLYNVIKLQFLLAIPFCMKLYWRLSLEKHQVTEKAFITLKCERRMVKVFYCDICYFEARGNYLVTHTVHGTLKTRLSISELEDKLPQDAFTRVHRSFIVSLNKVESFTSSLVVIGDKKIPIGRSYIEKARNNLS